jgi:hypothetical protein
MMVKLEMVVKIWFEGYKEWRTVRNEFELPEVPVQKRVYFVDGHEIELREKDSLTWSLNAGWRLDRTEILKGWDEGSHDPAEYLATHYYGWEVDEI